MARSDTRCHGATRTESAATAPRRVLGAHNRATASGGVSIMSRACVPSPQGAARPTPRRIGAALSGRFRQRPHWPPPSARAHAPPRCVTLPPRNEQGWRCWSAAPVAASLCVLLLWSLPVATAHHGVNLALDKAVAWSPAATEVFAADQLTDGDSRGNFDWFHEVDNTCAATNAGEGVDSWFRVDLEASYEITHVSVFFVEDERDAQHNHLRHIEVLVGDDFEDPDGAGNTVCGGGTFQPFRGTLVANTPLTVTCNAPGRFVFAVQRDAVVNNILCELEVYGIDPAEVPDAFLPQGLAGGVASVPDSNIMASSDGAGTRAYCARLDQTAYADCDDGIGWAPAPGSTGIGEYLEVALTERAWVSRIATQGSDAGDRYVSLLQIQYSGDAGETWHVATSIDRTSAFEVADAAVVEHDVAFEANVLRFIPQVVEGSGAALRLEVYGVPMSSLGHSTNFEQCDNGSQDGEETDVDCGGGLCYKCSAGDACAEARDCRSGNCANGVCEGGWPTWGRLLSSGGNTNGNLGLGDVLPRATPTAVPGMTAVTDVAAGSEHALAVQNGRLYAWGSNANGRLGLPLEVSAATTPTLIEGDGLNLLDVTMVAAGLGHSYAVSGEQVYSMGFNHVGQLGLGDNIDRYTPTLIMGSLTSVTHIAATETTACVVNDGQIYVWGGNSNDQMGLGAWGYDEPVQEWTGGSLTGFVSCAVSQYNVFGLRQIGESLRVFVSGRNYGGAAGVDLAIDRDGAATAISVWPTNWNGVGTTPSVDAIYSDHTDNGGCVSYIEVDGAIWSSGGGDFWLWQLGQGPDATRTTKHAPVSELPDKVEFVSASDDATIFVRGGVLYCLGRDTGWCGAGFAQGTLWVPTRNQLRSGIGVGSIIKASLEQQSSSSGASMLIQSYDEPLSLRFACTPPRVSSSPIVRACVLCDTNSDAVSCNVSYTVNGGVVQNAALVQDGSRFSGTVEVDLSELPAGDVAVEFGAVGSMGESSPLQSLVTSLDASAPNTTIEAAPPALLNVSTVILDLACNKQQCLFEYQHGASEQDAAAAEWAAVVGRPPPPAPGASFPQSSFASSGTPGLLSEHSSAVFVFAKAPVSGTLTGFRYRVDEAAWTMVESPHGGSAVVTGLSAGVHTFEVQGVEDTGDPEADLVVEPTPQTWQWEVLSQPVGGRWISIVGAPSSVTSETVATFTLSSKKLPAALQYCLDCGSPDDIADSLWESCGSTLTIGPLELGQHQLAVRGVSEVDTSDAIVAAWTIEDVPVSLELSGLDDGPHVVHVRALDAYSEAVEEVGGGYESAAFILDTTAPVPSPMVTGPSAASLAADATASVVVAGDGSVYSNARGLAIDLTSVDAHDVAYSFRARDATGEVAAAWSEWSAFATPGDDVSVDVEVAAHAGDGERAIEVNAVDEAGNVAAVEPLVWFLDSQAPTATATLVDGVDLPPLPPFVATTDVVFDLWCSENYVSSWDVSIDGAEWTSVDTDVNGDPYDVTAHVFRIAVPAVADGEHTVEVRCVDRVGNVPDSDGTSGPVAFGVDTTAPACTAAVASEATAPLRGRPQNPGGDGMPQWVSSGTVPLLLSGTDATRVTIEYRLTASGSAAGAFSAPLTPVSGLDAVTVEAADLPDGVYVVEARATDALGNMGAITDLLVRIDTVAPTTTIPVGASPSVAGTGGANAVSFSATCSDDDPVYSVAVDGSAPAWYDPESDADVAHDGAGATPAVFSIDTSLLGEGDHTVAVACVDRAGNEDPSPATTAFSVDRSTPVVSIAAHDGASPPPSWVGDQTALALAVADASDSVLTVLLDGAPAPECCFAIDLPDDDGPAPEVLPTGSTVLVTLWSLSDGPHVLTASAFDVAVPSNVGAPQSVAFTVDTTPPVVDIVNDPAPHSNAAYTDVSVACSDLLSPSCGFEYRISISNEDGCAVCLTSGDAWMTAAAGDGPFAASVRVHHTVSGEAAASLAVDDVLQGAFSIAVRTVDAAGLISEVAHAFWAVDTLPPPAPVPSVAPSSPSSAAAPAFAFSVSGDETVVRMQGVLMSAAVFGAADAADPILGGTTCDTRTPLGVGGDAQWFDFDVAGTLNLELPHAGAWVLRTRATDVADNAGCIGSYSWRYEPGKVLVPPVTDLVVPPPEATAHESIAVSVACVHDITRSCGVQYAVLLPAREAGCYVVSEPADFDGLWTEADVAIDNVTVGDATASHSATIVVPSQQDGRHRIALRSYDRGEFGAPPPEATSGSGSGFGAADPGVLVSAIAIHDWDVDRVKPAAPLLQGSPEPFSTSAAPEFQLAPPDGDTVKYYQYAIVRRPAAGRRARRGAESTNVDALLQGIDPGALEWVMVPEDGHVELNVDEQGQYGVVFRAVDAAENVGEPIAYEWTYTDAEITYSLVWHSTVASTSGWADAPFVVTLEASTGASVGDIVYSYSLDGADFVPAPRCERVDECAITIASLALGVHRIEVAAALAVSGRATGASNSAYQWTVDWCGAREYADISPTNGAVSCHACPDGALCSDNTTLYNMGTQAGWFRSEESARAQNLNEFFECPVADACPGGRPAFVAAAALVAASSNSSAAAFAISGQQTGLGPDGAALVSADGCAAGYTGLLCQVCAPSYFKSSNNVCLPCPDDTGSAASAALPVAVVAFILGVLGYKFGDFVPLDYAEHTLGTVQMFAAAVTVYEIDWPMSFRDLLDAFGLSNLEIMKLTKLSCTADEPFTFYTTFGFTMVALKVIVVGTVVLAWCRSAALRRRAKAEGPEEWPAAKLAEGLAKLRRSAYNVVANIVMASYLPVSMRAIQFFDCIRVDGEYYIEADLRLPCYEGTWSALAPYAAIMCLLYVVVLPLGMYLTLRKHKDRLDDEDVMGRFGVLYEIYRPNAYWWSVWDVLFKLMLSGVAVLFSKKDPAQVSYSCFVCIMAVVMFAHVKPHRDAALAVVDIAQLLALMLCFYVGLVLKLSEHDGETATSTDVLGVVLVITTLASVMFGVVVFVAVSARNAMGPKRARRWFSNRLIDWIESSAALAIVQHELDVRVAKKRRASELLLMAKSGKQADANPKTAHALTESSKDANGGLAVRQAQDATPSGADADEKDTDDVVSSTQPTRRDGRRVHPMASNGNGGGATGDGNGHDDLGDDAGAEDAEVRLGAGAVPGSGRLASVPLQAFATNDAGDVETGEADGDDNPQVSLPAPRRLAALAPIERP